MVVTVLSRVWTVDLLTLLAAGQSSAETSLGPYLIFSSATIEWNNINKSERLACHGWLFLELISSVICFESDTSAKVGALIKHLLLLFPSGNN